MTTITINATDSAAIRRDENVVTPFYKIGSTQSPYNEWYYRGLLYFDLSGIPSSAKITYAELQCYLIANLGTTSGTYSAHRITKSWVGSYVTREQRTSTANWSTIGGDFEASASAATPFELAASEPYGWKTWNFTQLGVTNLQNMVAGTTANYGWLLKNSENANRAHGFEYSGIKPKLTVYYSTPSDTGMVMMFY